MFFYIPGILTVIVAILIIFLVIPKTAPVILAITALILLFLGIYHHYELFANEYALSTWQQGLTFWAGPIMIGALVLTIVGYFTFFINGSSYKPVNVALPPANTATNPITEVINNAIVLTNNVNKKVNTLVNTAANNMLKMSKNAPKIETPSTNYNRTFFSEI
jgi:hypothetical protein